ncbi:MAG: hypothetical protein Q9O62_08155 [Ardenticatenia bacterium]|nr:hypothetical protein [Ardenticatenia bacterium]
MKKIAQTSRFPQGALAVQFAQADLEAFLAPLLRIWPDKRLRARAKAFVQGLRAAQSPHVTNVMQATARQGAWAAAKRGDRLLHSRRVTTHPITKRLYRAARQVVAEAQPEVSMVAIDPVQLEKPYTRRLEGVSQVDKSRPPDRRGKARLTWGYPAITATIVHLQQPAYTDVRRFSYQTPDFAAEPAPSTGHRTRAGAWFPQHALGFVLAGGGDAPGRAVGCGRIETDFARPTMAASEAGGEVGNERLARWEPMPLGR